MKKKFLKLFFVTLMFSNLALAMDESAKLTDLLLSVLYNIQPALELVMYISFTVGVFFIGMAGYKMARLGKDQQVRGTGVITRFIIGGVFVAIFSVASVFTHTLTNNSLDKQFAEDMSPLSPKKIERCTKSNSGCDNY